MVEAVRAGYIFARDGKQYGKWRRAAKSGKPASRGLSGEALERAVATLAGTHPQYVVMGA